jgi:hypothetical protein
MSFLTAVTSLALTHNKQALAQALVIDKKTVQQVSRWTSLQAKTYWKPVLAVTAGATLAMGAYKMYSSVKEEQRQQSIAPTTSEIERLGLSIEGIEYGKQLDSSMFEEMELLVNEYMSELELEDCLVADETQLDINKWIDPKHELEMREQQIKRLEQLDEISNGRDDNDEKVLAFKAYIKSKDEVELESYEKTKFRRNRKRVGRNMLPQAVKALAAKLRTSFPQPDGSPLQQKAMSLYAVKECRKLRMREAELSFMIPKAVTLASIPTSSQVDLRQIAKIEPVQLKYSKMAWSGYKNKASWLSKLAATLPTLH